MTPSGCASTLPCAISSHCDQHPLESLYQRIDAGGVEHVGVVFDTQAQFVSRLRLHRKRVVVGFPGGELCDHKVVLASQRGGVDRVVFVYEKGVEQLLMAADGVDLGQCQMLVLQGMSMGALQVVEQLGG